MSRPKKSPKKRPNSVKSTSTEKDSKKSFSSRIKAPFTKVQRRIRGFLQRRPHRSFRLTYRRDYKRSFRMPGYLAFTVEVTRILLRHKGTFLLLMLLFTTMIILFGLMGSQELYSQMRELLQESAPDDIFAGDIGKAGVILLTAATGGLSGRFDSGQTIIATMLSLYLWLVVVWLLRKSLAGKKLILRDGLYSAGAPILPTLILFLVLLVQLIPGALAVLVASTAWQTGLIEGGAASMALSIGLAFTLLLSLYWMVSTFIALVVVTLPGMYPMRAIAIAGDLVIGRRLRLTYRMLWMMALILLVWVVIMIPIILFDGWIKSIFEQIEWLPIVPVVFLFMTVTTVTWSCAYTYLLYRKVVDDDSSPA